MYKKSQKIIKTFAETPNFFVVGPVVTTTGFKNPIYPETRATFSDPARLQIIIDEIADFIKSKKIKYNIICGAATAGIMISSPLAMKLKVRQLYVRDKPKKGGRGLAVEGAYKKGERVILIDDATAAGKHKINFINNLRKVGLKIDWVIVPLCRNQSLPSDNSWIKPAKIKYQTFGDLNDVREYCAKKGIITREASQIIEWYMEDPTNWHRDKKKWQYFLNYKNKKRHWSISGV